MKKLSVTTVLLLALILGSSVAYAGFNWDGDPIFKVEGTTVKVLFAYEDPSDVSEVTLYVPEGVDARVVSSHGFKCTTAPGESVAVFVDASSDVLVAVRVPKYHIEVEGVGGSLIKIPIP